jgi:hypothetical protein
MTSLISSDVIKYLDFLNHSTYWFQTFKPDIGGIRQKEVLHTEFCSKDKVLTLSEKYNGQGLCCVAINERPKGGTLAKHIRTINTLIIDIDVLKSRKVLYVSTKEDNLHSQNVGEEIKRFLENQGYYVGVIVNSGNGCQVGLKVNIDISSEDKRSDFLSKVISFENDLGRFDDEVVKIDCITKDVNRRIKLPGTINKKDTHQGEDRIATITYLASEINTERNNAIFESIRINEPEKLQPENKPQDNSKSGKEYREVIKLMYKGKNKKEIFEEMKAFVKWTEQGEKYQEHTYKKALEYFTLTNKKKKRGEDFSFLYDKDFLNKLSLIYSQTYHLNGVSQEPFSWGQVKALTRRMYDDKDTLCFYYGDKNKFTGKLLNEIYSYKQQIHLFTVYKRKKDDIEEHRVVFFDEKFDKRGWYKVDSVSEKFWFYQFISDCCQYVVLSEEKLNLEYGDLNGMVIDLEEEAPLGSSAKIKLNLPVIVLSKWDSFSNKISTKGGFLNLLNSLGINREKYFNYLFSHSDKCTYNHPSYFQELISAFLLSSKEKLPLHLLLIAKPGTGKSTLEESIQDKFDEDEDIVEGSCSTLKALIPSFKGNLPAPGALLKTNRICVVDEFLRILMRVHKDERNEQLAALNPILEHKKRRIASGNGGLTMSPTSRCLMVSNPVWGTHSMEQLCDKIDRSFLSRLLIWYQDDDHIKRIQSGELKETTYFKIEIETWLGLLDYLHSFVAKYDKERVDNIYKQYFDLKNESIDRLVEGVREVYYARYQYHIHKLIDGIIKTRCLCTCSTDFTAKEEDYKLVEDIWSRMIQGWGVNVMTELVI